MSDDHDDPLSSAADPGRLDARVTRRTLAGLLLAAPAVAALPGCTAVRLGCAPTAASPSAGHRRFCRYAGAAHRSG